MSEYKLLQKGFLGRIPGGVIRTIDGAVIPEDSGNKEWIDYQEWLALGNIPDPMEILEERADGYWMVFVDSYGDVVSEIMIRSKADQVARQNDIQTILPSWAQVEVYLDGLANLADAKAALKKIARVVYWLAKNTQN
jgi:hypothetical protein